MEINANKSKLICFSRKKQNELDNNVIMTNGQVITVLVDCIKLQKIYIDNKFTFSKHIDQIIIIMQYFCKALIVIIIINALEK